MMVVRHPHVGGTFTVHIHIVLAGENLNAVAPADIAAIDDLAIVVIVDVDRTVARGLVDGDVAPAAGQNAGAAGHTGADASAAALVAAATVPATATAAFAIEKDLVPAVTLEIAVPDDV